MSRKYCSVCGKTHKNEGYGMCNKHLQEEECRKNEESRETYHAWKEFMERSEEDRWEIMFDYLRSVKQL
jgi:hypothetical protein